MSELLNINNDCKLSLPPGLTELMNDISREVLRALPDDPYQFIANYLAAMLVTRDNIHIASDICSEICEGPCNVELDDALRDLDLDEEDISKAKNIVSKYFNKDTVNETNLLIELKKKTSISEAILPAVQQAVRNSFKRQHFKQREFCEMLSADDDEVSQAINHTLKLYKATKPTYESYHKMAQKIQTETNSSPVNSKLYLRTVSSTSLAGSFMRLPRLKPYTPHERFPCISPNGCEVDEVNIDYSGHDEFDENLEDVSKYSETLLELHPEDDGINYKGAKHNIQTTSKDSKNEIYDEDEIEEAIIYDELGDDNSVEDSVDEEINEIDMKIEEHKGLIYADDMITKNL